MTVTIKMDILVHLSNQFWWIKPNTMQTNGTFVHDDVIGLRKKIKILYFLSVDISIQLMYSYLVLKAVKNPWKAKIFKWKQINQLVI